MNVRSIPAGPVVDWSLLLPGVDRLRFAVDGLPTGLAADPASAAVADGAVGPALMAHLTATGGLAGGGSTGWLRLYRPAPTVGFSTRDSRAPGFDAAREASLARGFAAVVRAPGGHAAAYHRGSLCFDLVVPDQRATVDVVAQLRQWGHLMVRVLRSLGVPAELGELPDEYCPGQYSVHAGGVKLVGTAGRRRPGAALVGGVLVVTDADPLRDVVVAVYAALGLPCDPNTVGSLADVLGRSPTTDGRVPRDPGAMELVTGALVTALAGSVPLDPAPLPDQVVADALAAAAQAQQARSGINRSVDSAAGSDTIRSTDPLP